jgi:glucosamine--fructose-6-phosphate aminotransferase (isomerizing)
VVRGAFEQELGEQPEALARLLAEGRDGVVAAAERIRRQRPAFAVLAARGSSDNAARYAQYVLGVRNGLVCALAAPSVFTRYHAQPRMEGALVIGISQSGRSPDIVAVVEEARRQGAVTLAITNDERSPLAAAAELVLPLRSGEERAVAATKTYTAQLLAVAMVSAALQDDAGAWEELARVPALAASAIELNRPQVGVAERFADRARLIVIGRGYNMATAFEIALKVKETCGVTADPYSSADFLHGPVALLERGLPLMVVAPAAAPFDDELDALAALAQERGAPLIAITDSARLLAQADVGLPLPEGVPEWLSPVAAVIPGQMWAQALAEARGRSADAPPGLRKVTLTR